VLHCRQRRTEPWPQVTCRKFHKVWNVTFEICEWTDRYIHWCSTVPYWGQINNVTTTTSSTFCFHSTSLVFWSYCRSGWVSQQHTTGGNRAATYTAVSLLQQDNAISQQWWNNTCRAFSAARNWSFSSSSTDIRLWFHGAVPSTDRIQQHFNNTITLYNQVLHTHTNTQPFYGHFSRATWVSPCQKKKLLDFYGAREDNRGRHTNNTAGRHSIRTNQRCTSIIPPFLLQMPFLPYTGLHTQWPKIKNTILVNETEQYSTWAQTRAGLRHRHCRQMPRGVRHYRGLQDGCKIFWTYISHSVTFHAL